LLHLFRGEESRLAPNCILCELQGSEVHAFADVSPLFGLPQNRGKRVHHVPGGLAGNGARKPRHKNLLRFLAERIEPHIPKLRQDVTPQIRERSILATRLVLREHRYLPPFGKLGQGCDAAWPIVRCVNPGKQNFQTPERKPLRGNFRFAAENFRTLDATRDTIGADHVLSPSSHPNGMPFAA